jgi:hypothetical protein
MRETFDGSSVEHKILTSAAEEIVGFLGTQLSWNIAAITSVARAVEDYTHGAEVF